MVKTSGNPEGRKPSKYKYQILVRYPEVHGERAPWEETNEYFNKKIDAETFSGVETIAGQGEEYSYKKVKDGRETCPDCGHGYYPSKKNKYSCPICNRLH